jgi:hypothetical protein
MNENQRQVITCEVFYDYADELTIGRVDTTTRSLLLLHAEGCVSCHDHLESLSIVSDQLLTFAPEIEPPSGFEARVLGKLALAELQQPPGTTSGRWRLLASVAAVLVVVAGFGGFVAGRYRQQDSLSGSQTHMVRMGPIVQANGATSGHVALLDAPRAFVLVTIDSPKPFEGELSCTLVHANGEKTVVGSWNARDVAAGVWSVGIDRSLLSSTSMHVTNADGIVLATATFGPV